MTTFGRRTSLGGRLHCDAGSVCQRYLGGMADLDHTLAVVRHWGGFPADTVVIEVEPSDCSFGPGFSEELGECI